MPKVVSVDQEKCNVDLKCPYRLCRVNTDIQLNMFEERFDFQFEENGKLGRKSLGVFDLVKEVNSHNGEVGLINCLKLAQARGIDQSIFAKREPGFMVDLSGIETVDDLIQKQKENDAKLQDFADKYGLTVQQLLNIVQSGDFESLKSKATEQASNEATKEAE